MSLMTTEDEQRQIEDEQVARALQDEEDRQLALSVREGWSGGTETRKGSDKPPEKGDQETSFAPPGYTSRISHASHTNDLISASRLREKDEQRMQVWLQSIQFQYRIYNSEVEPEHDVEYPCDCQIHQYQRNKVARYSVQKVWNKAVVYPGEKIVSGPDLYTANAFSSNPYLGPSMTPFPMMGGAWGGSVMGGVKIASPQAHCSWIKRTIELNNSLNAKAQRDIDEREPKSSIWDAKWSDDVRPASGKFSSFRQSIGLRTSDEREAKNLEKATRIALELRQSILREEAGRWPTQEWRSIALTYQTTYLHLLKAGYFEPIPVAWANANSNPLKFKIDGAEAWRGITPAWRGYEDTAEERLYWVLNHRAAESARLKPDFISALDMARERMRRAVPPPPDYYDAHDVCHTEHKSDGYSKQVLPPPFQPRDRVQTSSDDTMILLDVSGSMNFKPLRPKYDRYLITDYLPSSQPKNKDLAKAVIRRFTEAMENHDRNFGGYDLTTFSTYANFVGTVNHRNLDELWRSIQITGGTRVMTGWQKVKELHFEKHSASATHHPVYGWLAGPQTPMLRLLLLLDGEATDMDEFELDLLASNWAHVTIFLIGVDGCPHHHRHANELQRISDVNPHVSFVDAQGNTPERFVTHELLKRHLGYDLSIAEFRELEAPPAYVDSV